MFTAQQYADMPEYTPAAIQRMPLEDVCLQVKAISAESIEDFLIATIEPPTREGVRAAIHILKKIEALDAQENLTTFGRIAIRFPIDCRLTKALLYSLVFRCFEPVLRVVSMLSVKPPFLIATSNDLRTKIQKKKEMFTSGAEKSDFRLLYNVYDSLYGLQSGIYRKYDYCKENFLSYTALHEAKDLLETLKQRMGDLNFMHTKGGAQYSAANVNQNEWDIIDSCFVPALFPNLGSLNIGTDASNQIDEVIVPDRSCILNWQQASFFHTLKNNWIVYKDRVASARNFNVRVKNAAIVPAATLILFGGQEMAFDATINAAVIDGTIAFSMELKDMTVMNKARKWINKRFWDLANSPNTYKMSHEEGRKLKQLLQPLFACSKTYVYRPSNEIFFNAFATGLAIIRLFLEKTYYVCQPRFAIIHLLFYSA